MNVTREFLEQFYGDAISDTARFTLWFKHNKRHKWCSSIDDAVKVVTDDPNRDTYFSMAAYPAGCSQRTQDKASCLFGVWLDLDVGDKGNGKSYFPNMEAATTWIYDKLAGMWSFIVHSGGGIHLYLLFDEPFWIESDSDRAKARKVAKAFQRYAAQNCEYDIDTTFDVSRIMRLPGSYHSGTGEQCHIIDASEKTVDIDYLIDLLPPVSLGETSQVADDDTDVDIQDLKRRLSLIQQVDTKFDKTWRRIRRFSDSSPSSYCMSIANQLVVAGLSNGEIMAALHLWRSSQVDANDKPRSWYQATVAKARAGQNKDQKDHMIDVTLAEAPNLDEEGKKEAVKTVFNIPVERFVKRIIPPHKGHEEKCSYVMHIEGGQKIEIDSTASLLSQNIMKVLITEKLAVTMKHLKAPQYLEAIQILLDIREEEVQDMETNTAFQVEQQLRSYVNMKLDSAEVQEHLQDLRPSELFKDGNKLYFMWTNFKMKLENNRIYLSNSELASILRDLGSEPRQLVDKRRTRVWLVPEELR